ncbi:MAG: penicillin-binding protein transpeptidase [Myxococcales bacterium]|nr:penicillin-binding protein transpeptidase [Myxococcales bacterium]
MRSRFGEDNARRRERGGTRVRLLAVAALLAGAGLFMRSGAGPAAKIEGDPLDTRQTPEEVAKFQALAQKPITKPAELPPIALAIDFDHITKEGDHYEAPLADGRRAILTLDPDLQTLAEKLLDQARAPRGAIVAMAPDGRILALAGRRTAEPKGGTKGTADWHLATEVWAPAASIFKLVTASALVGSGVDPDDKICYHGGLRSVTDSNLRDTKSDNNCQSLSYGVAHSNNAILGKLAYQKLEPTALDKLARDLGLAGMLPDTLGLAGTFGELSLPQTRSLELAQAAAGFSGSRLSVLGGALLAATFADAGEQPKPRLVASIVGAGVGAAADTIVPPPHRVLAETIARSVGKMMVATCDSGSASRSFGKRRPIKVAGKTGTLTTNTPFFMEHSWFVGYAPAEKPEIIVSVLLGNPESWHLRGHEAARKMIDRAVHREEDRADKLAERQAKQR